LAEGPPPFAGDLILMPHDRYTIRQNAVGRCSLLPQEAADLLEILNDVDRLKRRF